MMHFIIAYDLDNFITTIITYPDLAVIFGNKELLKELNDLLRVDSKLPQLLSYDTTFQLGDFHLSPLLLHHVLFSGAPVIPACFILHERKFQKTHEDFMHCVASFVPNLAKGGKIVPIVTDDEVGIFQAIGKELKSAKRTVCWNHNNQFT